MQIKLGDRVTHPEIYYGKEVFEVVGIRDTELELKGDWSGGTHRINAASWFKRDGCVVEQ